MVWYKYRTRSGLLCLSHPALVVFCSSRYVFFSSSCLYQQPFTDGQPQALVRASTKHSKYASILNATAGAIFLGTPFQGSHKVFKDAVSTRVLLALEANGGGQAASGLVRYLQKNEEGHHNNELDELVQQFCELLRVPELAFPIFCFYETVASDFRGFREKLPAEYAGLVTVDFGIVSFVILSSFLSCSFPELLSSHLCLEGQSMCSNNLCVFRKAGGQEICDSSRIRCPRA